MPVYSLSLSLYMMTIVKYVFYTFRSPSALFQDEPSHHELKIQIPCGRTQTFFQSNEHMLVNFSPVQFSCSLIIRKVLIDVLRSSNSRLVDLLSRCSRDARFNIFEQFLEQFSQVLQQIFNTLLDTKNLVLGYGLTPVD